MKHVLDLFENMEERGTALVQSEIGMLLNEAFSVWRHQFWWTLVSVEISVQNFDFGLSPKVNHWKNVVVILFANFMQRPTGKSHLQHEKLAPVISGSLSIICAVYAFDGSLRLSQIFQQQDLLDYQSWMKIEMLQWGAAYHSILSFISFNGYVSC